MNHTYHQNVSWGKKISKGLSSERDWQKKREEAVSWKETMIVPGKGFSTSECLQYRLIVLILSSGMMDDKSTVLSKLQQTKAFNSFYY